MERIRATCMKHENTILMISAGATSKKIWKIYGKIGNMGNCGYMPSYKNPLKGINNLTDGRK